MDPNGRPNETVSHDNIKTNISWLGDLVEKSIWIDSDGSEIAALSYYFEDGNFRVKEIKLNNNSVANIVYDYNNGRVKSINSAKYSYSTNQPYVNNIEINLQGINRVLRVTSSTSDDVMGAFNINTFSIRHQQDNTPLVYTLSRNFDKDGQASKVVSEVLDTNTQKRLKYDDMTARYDLNNRLIAVEKNQKSYKDNVEINQPIFSNNYIYVAKSNNNVSEFTRVSETGGQVRRTIAAFSNDDRLVSLRGSISRDYTYTADGDLETMTNCYGITKYTYDIFSNLKKVELPDGKVIEYKVDASNRRIKKLINGQVKEYYLWYDQIRLAAILDQNKIPKLTYIYGPESQSPGYVIKDGVTYKMIHDPGLGSVRYVVDVQTHEIVQELEYDEYGNIMKNTNPDFQPVGYAGGLYDSDTKLIRFGARDYDPTIGRWTTKDPIGFAGGDTNLYAYVGGNPMSLIDPTGLVGQVDRDEADAGFGTIDTLFNFIKNYSNMVNAGLIGADAYFHCKANCESATNSRSGSSFSAILSDLRENAQDALAKQCKSDRGSDQAANKFGRDAGVRGLVCADACLSLVNNHKKTKENLKNKWQ